MTVSLFSVSYPPRSSVVQHKHERITDEWVTKMLAVTNRLEISTELYKVTPPPPPRRGVPPGSPNPDPISEQKMLFSKTVFR